MIQDQVHNLLLELLSAKAQLVSAQAHFDKAYFAFYDAVIKPLPREEEQAHVNK